MSTSHPTRSTHKPCPSHGQKIHASKHRFGQRKSESSDESTIRNAPLTSMATHRRKSGIIISSESRIFLSTGQAATWNAVLASPTSRPLREAAIPEMIDGCMPLHILCPTCAISHRRRIFAATFREHLRYCSPSRYRRNTMDCEGMSLVQFHDLNFSTCHLILRAHRLGPHYGVRDCKTLRRFLEWQGEWYKTSQARMLDDRLLIRVESLRPILYHQGQNTQTQVCTWETEHGTTCPHPSTAKNLKQACLEAISDHWPP
jgi:hypothetical protein